MTCKLYCPTPIIQEVGVVPETGYNPFFFPPEGAYLPFFFTEETFLRVFSSLVNGAQFTYKEQGRAVLWEFLRNVEYPVSICDAIIDCINNNPATRAAIVDALKSDAEFNEYLAQEVYRLTEGQIGGKLLPGDCDNSVLAGRAIALVNRLDLNNQDFLEVMEVGTNDEERVADLIGAIPVAETFPVDEVFLIAQDFLEDFAENYNAASTEGRKDELARLIYCAMLSNEDCSITFQQLFNVFQEKALSGLTVGSTIGDVIMFLGTGDFSNDDAIFYGLMAIQMAFVLASRDFYGIEIGTISGIMRDALPSSRWEEWDPCGEVGERIPVIASLWDPANVAGTLSGPNSEGVWTVTSGTRAADEAFVIMDIEGRLFVLTDVVYSETPSCQVMSISGTPFYLACGVGNNYTGQTMDEFWTTWTSGAHRTMQFKMVAP